MTVVRIVPLILACGLAAAGLMACATGPGTGGGGLTADGEAAVNDSLLESARNAERARDYRAAAVRYARLYERSPGQVEPLLGQARNLRYDGRAREAANVLRVGLEAHGQDPALLLEHAKAQFAAAMTNDAAGTLERLLAIDPENWQAVALKAMLLDRQEDFSGAHELYRQAIELSAGDAGVVNNYGLSLAQGGQLDRAIEVLEELAHGGKSTFQARQNLVMLYVIGGDMDKARQLSRQDLPPDKVAQNLAAYQTLVDRGVAPAAAGLDTGDPAPGVKQSD